MIMNSKTIHFEIMKNDTLGFNDEYLLLIF